MSAAMVRPVGEQQQQQPAATPVASKAGGASLTFHGLLQSRHQQQQQQHHHHHQQQHQQQQQQQHRHQLLHAGSPQTARFPPNSAMEGGRVGDLGPFDGPPGKARRRVAGAAGPGGIRTSRVNKPSMQVIPLKKLLLQNLELIEKQELLLKKRDKEIAALRVEREQLLSRLESAVQEAEFAKRETDRERERNAATRASSIVHDGLDANCELTPEEASLERVKEEPVSPLSTASHHCARDAGSRKRSHSPDSLDDPPPKRHNGDSSLEAETSEHLAEKCRSTKGSKQKGRSRTKGLLPAELQASPVDSSRSARTTARARQRHGRCNSNTYSITANKEQPDHARIVADALTKSSLGKCRKGTGNSGLAERTPADSEELSEEAGQDIAGSPRAAYHWVRRGKRGKWRPGTGSNSRTQGLVSAIEDIDNDDDYEDDNDDDGEPFLRTSEMYLCHQFEPASIGGDDFITDKDETVMIPSWREKVYEPLDKLPFDEAENTEDETYAKRHAKLEVDEKRRKRWDIQRIREQRQLQKLRERTFRKEGVPEPEPEMLSFFPEPEDVEILEVTPLLPVVAFGRPIPRLSPQDFELPWLDDRSRQRVETPKKQSSLGRSKGR
uniref:PEHE domain-containing protein n=1 Tax=Eptatretus burgeri TaxID=7764 RepID=A0A8C4QK34_EPTBU